MDLKFYAEDLYKSSCYHLKSKDWIPPKAHKLSGFYVREGVYFKIMVPFELTSATYEDGVLLCKLGNFPDIKRGAIKSAFYTSLISNCRTIEIDGTTVYTNEVFRADLTWLTDGQRYTAKPDDHEVLRFYLTKARASTNPTRAQQFDDSFYTVSQQWEYLKDHIAIGLYKEEGDYK